MSLIDKPSIFKAIIFFIFLSLMPNILSAEEKNNTSVSPISSTKLVSLLNHELNKIENTYIPPRSGLTLEFKLKEAVIEYARIKVNKGDGTFKIGVPQYGVGIEAGGGSRVKIMDKVKITLSQPTEMVFANPPQLSQLANSIIELKKEILSIAVDNPELRPTNLKLTKEFGVKEEIKAGGGINILIFEIGGSGGKESEFSNKIILDYKINYSS